MVQEGNLFNSAPGCDLTISGVSDPANLNCGTAPVAPNDAQVNSLNSGENGYAQALENPYDDYTVQAPAVGSGSGVNQLKNTTAGQFYPNYARSSAHRRRPTARPSRTTCLRGRRDQLDRLRGQGLHALPGPLRADPHHWDRSPRSGPAPSRPARRRSARPTSHRRQQLGLPHPGHQLSSTEYTAVNKPIDCYIPQAGSGTAGTWAGDFGYTKSETTGGCLSDAQGDGRSTQGAASHINLFENTMAQIASGKINGHYRTTTRPTPSTSTPTGSSRRPAPVSPRPRPAR